MNARVQPSTLRREHSTLERVPYVVHVAPHLVKTAFGDYVQVLRLGGGEFRVRGR